MGIKRINLVQNILWWVSAKELTISYSARAKKGSKKNPFIKEGDLISVKNSLLGKSTGIIREFTAPFVGIYSTKEIIESFNDWLIIKKDPFCRGLIL